MKTFQRYLVDEHDFDTLVEFWNEYCQEEGDLSDFIYHSIDDVAELFDSPLEMARAVFFGSVENWHDKVYLDVYGNIQSVWAIENSPIDTDALAQWLEDIMHRAYKAYLDEYETEEDSLEEAVDW